MSILSLKDNFQLLRRSEEVKAKAVEDPKYSRPGQRVTHPILVPHETPEAKASLSAKEAGALKVLTFSGSRFLQSPHLKVEEGFIRALSDKNIDLDEKAAIVDMLGRTQSLRALPSLKNLLNAQEDVGVRIASINSLATIVSTTNPDSYTRTELGDLFTGLYDERKKALAKMPNRPVNPLAPSPVSEQRELLVQELKTLAEALGRLNVGRSAKFLQSEFKGSFDAAENNTFRAQEVMRAMRMAEEEFLTDLERKLNKPIKQIIADMPPSEVGQLQSKIQVNLPDGSKMNMLEAKAQISQLELQHRLANDLIDGLVDGLAHIYDNQATAHLKLALGSSQPALKAKALDLLAERNELNYVSEIYPALKHRDPNVRVSATNALLYSNDAGAKQKALEMLNPIHYFEVISGGKVPNRQLLADNMDNFQDFVYNVALNGDRFVGALKKVATDKEYDVQSRKMALEVLSLIAGPVAADSVSPDSAKDALDAIRSVASKPSATSPDEKEFLGIFSNSLLASLKDADAVENIFKAVSSPFHRLTDDDRMDLLITVLDSLNRSAGLVSDEEEGDRLGHRLLNIIEDVPGLFDKDAVDQARANLKPSLKQKIADPDSVELLYEAQKNQALDTQFLSKVQSKVDTIRPTLLKLLDHPQSAEVRMLAAQMIGLMNDSKSAVSLIDKVREPLKGMVDWNKPVSYRGDMARDGANIRLNSLMSLGRIGKGDALAVMTDALDDPTLRRYVPGPMKQIAADANKTADAATLKAAKEKLLQVVSSDDTSRLVRSVRIAAADALFQYKDGVNDLKDYLAKQTNPNFKRHVISALIANDYALDPKHADHGLVKNLLYPGLGVEKLHAKGITGKGIEMAIVDGGYVDKDNAEGFQNRVKWPPSARDPENTHPTMVMTTAAGNGKLKGVAPDAVAYSDKWPDFEAADPMEVYKKIIEGKLRGENNVRVINNSWGFNSNGVIVHRDIRDLLNDFKNVVDMAERAGIQIVFSAGNSGEEMGVPSLGSLGLFGLDVNKMTAEDKKILDYALERVLIVGASNTQGFDDDFSKHTIAEFSSIGDSLNNKFLPTVVAPGVDMMVYGYENGKRSKELVNGTSFSGPYVAGLVALMFQVNPKITPAEVRDILKKTAVKLPGVSEAYQGKGEVNPLEAVAQAQALGKAKKSA